LIKTLAKCENISITDDAQPKMLKSVVDTSTHVYVSIAAGVNLTEELNKISKQVATLVKFIDGLKAKIEKKGYTDKVPEDVQIQDKEKLKEKEIELKQVNEVLQLIQNITGTEATPVQSEAKPIKKDKKDKKDKNATGSECKELNLKDLNQTLSKNMFLEGDIPTTNDLEILKKIKKECKEKDLEK